MNKIFHHSEKEHPKISEIPKLKITENIALCPVKFSNIVYICITHGKPTTFETVVMLSIAHATV